MKKLILCLCVFFTGCTKTATTTSTLTPIQAVGCDVETAVTASFATGVVKALTCTNEAAVQASLLLAFGNANLCSNQVTAVSAVQIKAAVSKAIKPQGVIGNIACPIAVSTALGYLTNSVPVSWGCSASASATTLSTALISLCESAIPL